MKRIFKYELETTDEQYLMIPSLPNTKFKSQVLCIDVQHSKPCMWVLVDDECELKDRKIKIRGTGHPCEEVFAENYLGSFQLLEGYFVGHVFGE